MRHILFCVLLLACDKKKEAPKPTPASGTAMVSLDAAAEGSGSAGSGSAGSAASAFDPGELSTPESVLYDVGRDMYMVSNIAGKPGDADDNGYLTVVNPDGSNERSNANWKWIMGEMPDIKLDAPKGMSISGDTLYVADITVVRRFEAKAGKQLDDIKIEGATFLNDVTPDGKGGVYVSDTGVDKDFNPTDAAAIHHIAKDGKVTPLLKDKAMGGPNGVWYDGKALVWVVTFGTGEIFSVDSKGKKSAPQKLPTGKLDGIVGIDGGEFLVSSWDGKCVYRGKPGGEWKAIVSDVESPADIDYDPKRKRLIIPGFMTNKITVHQL